jgi:hypothetical protein
MLLMRGEIELDFYRLDRTGRDTRAAVDTDIWVDIETITIPVKALDGARYYAICKPASRTVLGNDVGHSISQRLL